MQHRSNNPVAVRGRNADETFLYMPFDEPKVLRIGAQSAWRGTTISKGQESLYKALLIACFEDCGFVAYCIENEEKEPGWPDVLVTRALDNRFLLVEVKVSDNKGVIKFESSQPLFYVRNGLKLPIHIYAFDVRYKRTILVPPSDVIKGRSLRYRLPDEGEVDLLETYAFGNRGYRSLNV